MSGLSPSRAARTSCKRRSASDSHPHVQCHPTAARAFRLTTTAASARRHHDIQRQAFSTSKSRDFQVVNVTRAAKLHEDAAERTCSELRAALTALSNRVEALEAARAHGVSRLPASAQTDPRDLPLKARICCDMPSDMPRHRSSSSRNPQEMTCRTQSRAQYLCPITSSQTQPTTAWEQLI